MEEKQGMAREELEARIENCRSKATVAKVILYAAVVGCLLTLVGGFYPGLAVCVLITLAAAYHLGKNSSEIKELLSDNIIKNVLKEVLGDAVEYNPDGRVKPGDMVFPFPYDKVYGSDHIKAVYKGLNIELSDIELENREEHTDANGNTDSSSVTFFKGQWLICDFGKELGGDVFISERTRKDRTIMTSDVTMENQEFKKRFCVKASDPQEAYYILTPHMMEYIIRMADKSGGTVYMSFLRNGKMHIAVKTGRDFFELERSKVNIESLRQKFLDELRWFTDIIDTLQVEDTLYKKETNV